MRVGGWLEVELLETTLVRRPEASTWRSHRSVVALIRSGCRSFKAERERFDGVLKHSLVACSLLCKFHGLITHTCIHPP